MDYCSLLTDSKWNIVKELSKEEQSPTALAKKTNTSLANISQQLRLLEAYGIVKKERKPSNKEPGKPRKIYSIAKNINHIMFIENEVCEKKNLELDPVQKAILNMWMHLKKENIYFLEKFLFANEDILNKCQAIGLVKSDDKAIDLLLVTERIDEIREKYSNQTVEDLEGHKKKIVCWTHSMQEIENGINHHNEHFMWLTEKLKTILEKDSIIKKIKDLKNGKNT